MGSTKKGYQKATSECYKLRDVLAKKFGDATFRVIVHEDGVVPSNENVIIARKRRKNSYRVSINYKKNQVKREDLLQHLKDCGYGNFVGSYSYDGVRSEDGYDARLVGYVHEACSTLGVFG